MHLTEHWHLINSQRSMLSRCPNEAPMSIDHDRDAMSNRVEVPKIFLDTYNPYPIEFCQYGAGMCPIFLVEMLTDTSHFRDS